MRGAGAGAGAGGPGVDATEDDLRDLRVDGYHPPQQFRTVETTRRLLVAGWDAMAAAPASPLRLEEVLARAEASASSFYSRFDGVEALVACLGLLALQRRPGEVASVDDATREVVAPMGRAGALPREVLAAGMWSDGYVDARRRTRPAVLRRLVVEATVAGDEGGAAADRGLQQLLTWLHLAEAGTELWWAIGGLVVPEEELRSLSEGIVVLGSHLSGGAAPGVDRRQDGADGPWTLPDLASPRVPGRIGGTSDRSALAVAELRTATRDALVERGRALSPADVARSVHRSRTAFFDAFGTVGAALADLARSEQAGRVPTQLFRPRPDVGPEALVAHLVHRIRAWQDHQGIVGRRLLQAAGGHPELAAELSGQLLASAELLASWYAPMLSLPEDQVRLVFLLLLASEQHQVVWGAQPDAIVGPDALAALLAPVLGVSDERDP